MFSKPHYYLKRISRLTRPKTSGIERLIYAVTYHCNSRCIMCNIWNEKHSSSDELNLKDLTHQFNNTSLFKNLTDIGLTGGEPFLKDDLAVIALFFLNHFPNARLSINTNGLLGDKIIRVTKSLIRELPQKGRNRIRISFSIDGMDATHDYIRGIPNNFKKVIEIIKNIKHVIPDIEYGLTFTILPENFDQIRDVYLLSKELDVGFSFSMAQTSGSFYQNTNILFEYSEDMFENIDKQIRDIQEDSSNFRNYYYSKMVEYKKNPHQYVTCYAGHNSFFLNPYGNVYPCILYDNALGNIKKNSIQEIMNCINARKILDQIRKSHCHCWGCESEVSFRRSWKIMLWKLFHSL